MQKTWNCYKCKAALDEVKIGFRTLCEKCHAYQHSCKGCKHYSPGKPNDCLIPGTDPIRDRELFNFCEDFSPKLEDNSSLDYNSALEKAKKLLG
ncbi:hypothetical protein N9Y92_02930 [Chlamydiales bacterium]|nr:hypothetical protein [Chlamydiales bacterium]